MNRTAVLQYQMVQDARKVLLDYCESLSNEHLNAVPEGFGNRSIKDILIHIANVYINWLSNFALKKELAFTETETIRTFSQIRKAFEVSDQQMKEFLQAFQNTWNDPVSGTVSSGIQLTHTPLTIFTHVITHEFHHKGQILAISRWFGYTPPDTDVIRF